MGDSFEDPDRPRIPDLPPYCHIYNHKASQVRVNQIQYSASNPLRRRRRKTITMTLPKTTMSNCRGCKTRESRIALREDLLEQPRDTGLQQVLWASSDPNCSLARLSSPQAQLKHTHTHGSSLHPNGQEPTNGASVGNVPDTLDNSTTSDSGQRRGRDSFGCSCHPPPCWLASARL